MYLRNRFAQHRRIILAAVCFTWTANIILYLAGFEYRGLFGTQFALLVAAALVWTAEPVEP